MAEPPSATQPAPSGIAPMCLACGQMLTGTETKCPSCGAPIRGRAPNRRSAKLTVALVLFLGLALVNGTQAAFALIGPEPSAAGPAIGPWAFPITGTVHYENGTAAAQVRVTIDHSNATQTRTDANGSYTINRVPAGYRIVTFEAANHTTTDYKVFVRQKETVDARLVPGQGNATFEHASYPFLRTFFLVAGIVSAALTVVFVVAAVACARRIGYVWALAGAWVSLLSVLTTVGITIVISLILIVLVMRSKKEFR